MKEIFKGPLRNYLHKYVEHKRALGYKYQDLHIHKKIDEFSIHINHPSNTGITEDFFTKYSKERTGESRSNRKKRINYLIAFSKFLNDIDVDSYVGEGISSKEASFEPYIYNDDEISSLFKALKSLKLLERANRDCFYISFPGLLSILYGTGIRVGEALNLKFDDINLNERFIVVKDSKNHLERMLPLSDSVAKNLFSHIDALKENNIENDEGFIFCSYNGKKMNYQTAYTIFRKCLKEAKIPFLGDSKGPRIHDLRHTFAVNAMLQLEKNGYDLYVALPILSVFLGHSKYTSTERYVRLTLAHSEYINDLLKKSSINLLPKF